MVPLTAYIINYSPVKSRQTTSHESDEQIANERHRFGDSKNTPLLVFDTAAPRELHILPQRQRHALLVAR